MLRARCYEQDYKPLQAQRQFFQINERTDGRTTDLREIFNIDYTIVTPEFIVISKSSRSTIRSRGWAFSDIGLNSNIDRTRIHSNIESEPINSNVESEPINTNVESEHINSNVESEHINSNVESEPINSNVESEPINTNVERIKGRWLQSSAPKPGINTYFSHGQRRQAGRELHIA